jgi:hypothetical protein
MNCKKFNLLYFCLFFFIFNIILLLGKAKILASNSLIFYNKTNKKNEKNKQKYKKGKVKKRIFSKKRSNSVAVERNKDKKNINKNKKRRVGSVIVKSSASSASNNIYSKEEIISIEKLNKFKEELDKKEKERKEKENNIKKEQERIEKEKELIEKMQMKEIQRQKQMEIEILEIKKHNNKALNSNKGINTDKMGAKEIGALFYKLEQMEKDEQKIKLDQAAKIKAEKEKIESEQRKINEQKEINKKEQDIIKEELESIELKIKEEKIKEEEKKKKENIGLTEEEIDLKKKCLKYYEEQYNKTEDENLIIYGLKKLTELLRNEQKANQFTKIKNYIQPCYLEAIIIISIIYASCSKKNEVDVILDKIVKSQLAKFTLSGEQIPVEFIDSKDILIDLNDKNLAERLFLGYDNFKSIEFKLHRGNQNAPKNIIKKIGPQNKLGIGLTASESGHYFAIIYDKVISNSLNQKNTLENYLIEQNKTNKPKSFVYFPLSKEEIYQILNFKYDTKAFKNWGYNKQYLLYLGEK